MTRRLFLLVLASALTAGQASPAPAWTADDLAVLQTIALSTLGAPPPDPSSRVADDPGAARLGKMLFFDRRLSASGRVSCASCHQPERGFTDARAVGRGMARGSRRTMPVAAAAFSPWQFWDGRADSLWSQALGPIENPVEHGFTRTEAVRTLAARYRPAYESVFGVLPARKDLERLPLRASPSGDARAQAAWAGMAGADQARVNRAFADLGKAVAAYERTLRVRPGRFDAYVAGLVGEPSRTQRLTRDEIAGLRLFTGKAQCVTCHNGPLFSNQGFANTGVRPRRGQAADPGRSVGVRKAVEDPFNCKGGYGDARPEQCEELEFVVVDSPAQVGAFKVPSLRGVGRRAPYMHAGQLTSLAAVVEHYDRAPAAAVGASELRPLHLSVAERRQIVAFLRTLDEAPPPHGSVSRR